MSDEGYAYISYQPCGCLGMTVIDNPERSHFVAEEVARAIRRGEVIERVATESVKTIDWKCPKHKLEAILDEATEQKRLTDV